MGEVRAQGDVSALHNPLDVTRDEMAWREFGRAVEEVNLAGAQLERSFTRYQAARDALVEQRLGEGQPYWTKPVEVAYAAWHGEQCATDTHALTWPRRSEA